MNLIELRVGDMMKDNDPSMPNRVLTIRRVEALSVTAQDSIGR